MTPRPEHEPKKTCLSLFRFVASRCLPRSLRDPIIGDLEEIYCERSQINPAEADSWYRKQAMGAARSGLLLRMRRSAESMGRPQNTRPASTRMTVTMTNLLNDLNFGVRLARKRPAFSAIIVVTLALGIATSSLMFSGLHSFLLKPLPYESPDRVLKIWSANLKKGWDQIPVSFPDYTDWRSSNRTFEDLAAYSFAGFNLRSGEAPERVRGLRMTANLPSLLGSLPVRGRFFTTEEDRSQSKVAIISHALWQRILGGESDVVGREIFLDSVSYEIIGVMSPQFWFPDSRTDLWVPLGASIDESPRDLRNLRVIGRLGPGRDSSDAQADLELIAGRLGDEYPESNQGIDGVRVAPIVEDLFTPEMVRSIEVLFAAGLFVLVIACVNITNLLLSRSAARRREIAMRAALGAGRLRILRQLIMENIVLAALGSGLGVFLAHRAIALIIPVIPAQIPRVEDLSISVPVLGFATLASLTTVFLFSLVPALELSGASLQTSLSEGGRGGSGATRGRRLQSALVIIEVALSLTLLIGAGLLMKSILRVQSIETGFDQSNLLTTRLNLPAEKYGEEHERQAFFDRIREESRSGPLPLLTVTNLLPISTQWYETFQIEGREVPLKDNPQWALIPVIETNYLETMRIRLVKGRAFTPRDDADSTKVVLINETMARRHWPEEDPIGRRIRLSPYDDSVIPPLWREIVGVVGDIRHRGQHRSIQPEVYRPLKQGSSRNVFIVVRTLADPEAAVPDLAAMVAAIDPDLALYQISSMDQVVVQRMWGERLTAQLMAVCALGALLLALVGLYGVISQSVSQRTQEIGVRMALGARTADVLRLVVRRGMILTGIGLLLGLAGGFGMGVSLGGLLVEMSGTDPWTFLPLSLLMLAVSFTACYLPARRASAVDPSTALRCE